MKKRLAKPTMLTILAYLVIFSILMVWQSANVYAKSSTNELKPVQVKATVKTVTTNELSWAICEENYGSVYLEIYRKDPGNDKYVKIREIDSIDCYVYSDDHFDYYKMIDNVSKAAAGKFSYKIVNIGYGFDSDELVEGAPAFCSVTNIKLPSPGKVIVSTKGYTTIGVSWTKVEKANGYFVYRQRVGEKARKLIKTTGLTKLTDYDLKKNDKYKYTVVPYRVIDGVKVRGAEKSVIGNTGVLRTQIKSIVTYSNNAYLTWGKIPDVSGYEIYRGTSLYGNYTKIATLKGSDAIKHTDQKLSANKKYFYKVRGYKYINGNKYVGYFSDVKNKTISARSYTYYKANIAYRQLKNSLYRPETLRLKSAYYGTIRGQKVTLFEYSAENKSKKRFSGYYSTTYADNGWYSKEYKPSDLANRKKLDLEKLK